MNMRVLETLIAQQQLDTYNPHMFEQPCLHAPLNRRLGILSTGGLVTYMWMAAVFDAAVSMVLGRAFKLTIND
jgi:hypothetical protein